MHQPKPSPEAVIAAWRSLTDPSSDLAVMLTLHPAFLDRVVDKAVGLLDAGKAAEGEELLECLCLVELRSVSTPFLLGACKAGRRDLPGAIAAYSEAIRRSKEHPDPIFLKKVHLCRGEAYALGGDPVRARSDFELAAALPGSDPALSNHLRSRLAAREAPR